MRREFGKAIREGEADLRAGRVRPYEDVRREFLLPATVPQQVLDALEECEEALKGPPTPDYTAWNPEAYRKWYRGERTAALARLAAAREQAKETG